MFKPEAKTDNTKSWQGHGVSGTLILLMAKRQKKELTLKMLKHILYVKVILNKTLKKAQKISKNGWGISKQWATLGEHYCRRPLEAAQRYLKPKDKQQNNHIFPSLWNFFRGHTLHFWVTSFVSLTCVVGGKQSGLMWLHKHSEWVLETVSVWRTPPLPGRPPACQNGLDPGASPPLLRLLTLSLVPANWKPET